MEIRENLEFKKSYPYIFSFFYLSQGLYNGIQYIIIPFWLISMMEIDLAVILGIFSITVIPWALKFLIGMFNDKVGSERFGRRKLWILIFGIYAGIWFIITGFTINLQTEKTILNYILLCAIMWNIGIAVSDTSLDGLILDVTPKEKLGKVQGYTWAMNLFGNAGGGIILGALFLMLDAIPLLFVFEGILLIISSIFPFYVKEKPLPENIQVWKNMKEIIRKGKNWKVFIFSFLDSIPYGVVTIAYTILILLYAPNPLISGPVTSLSLEGVALEAFLVYVLLGAINGAGVIIGSIMTGRKADKNRRFAVYIANFTYIPFLVICVLFRGPYVLGGIMIFLLGAAQGALTASYQSIRGDLSKKYPELNSTYFAIVISCLNLGQSVGMATTSILITLFSSAFNEYYMIFFFIMLIMAGFQFLSFLIFYTINRSEYEHEHILKIKNT
jgi:MFS family permease